MNKDVVENHETLYRVVKKSYPDAFIEGQASPALFMDKRGLSVDRDGNRDEDYIIDKFKHRFKSDYGGAVSITAFDCRQAGTHPIPNPTNSNKYHAEIHESDNIVEISLLKAFKLAQLCTKINK